MLELLARIGPAAGLQINTRQKSVREKALEKIANATACPACKYHSSQRKARCGVCNGSGHTPLARCKETRPRSSQTLPVAYLISGLDQKSLDAAMTAVTADPVYIEKVAKSLINKDFLLEADRWRSIKKSEKSNKIRDLALLSALELAFPNKFKTEADRYRQFGVSESAWYRVWRERYALPRNMALEWVDRAERHMMRRAG